MDKKTRIRLIFSILLSIALIAGVTYAIFNYVTDKTNVVMNIDGDDIQFDAGTDITINNMLPVYTMDEGVYKDIIIYKKNNNYKAGINLFLNLKTWPVTLSDTSFRWALYKNGEYYTSGDFKSYKQGNNIKLTASTQPLKMQEESDTYRLYLWIDAYQESNINMMNKSFIVSVYGQVSFYDEDDVLVQESTPNAPELAEGMIPIKYNNVIDEWQKADVTNNNNDWYDYGERHWANAVMVKETSRNEYMNASVGTTINEDDILAYYVWIPRYRYLLFNVESQTMDAQEIQIEFQKKTDEISNGTKNGEFLTHPAFWWDNNSNGIRESGEELSGIWVSKFQTGGTENTPLVKPGIISKNGLNYLQLFNMNKNFESTTYLTESGANSIDSHITKNIEWGAVAYLTHSRYGINQRICLNNSSSYITGRSGGAVASNVAKISNHYSGLTTASGASIGNGYYTYNDFYINYDGTVSINKETGLGQCASTTGNVTGIYDMSGLYTELVMAFVKGQNGQIVGRSGFTSTTIPESKYYDAYEAGTSASECSRRILGDAICEIRGWYGAGVKFITSTGYSWFVRGDSSGDAASVYTAGGILAYTTSDGSNVAYSRTGARSVIVLP